MTALGGDDRGVSEAASVAALVVMTVVVTASVGMGVLFVGDDGSESVDADLEFRHFSGQSVLFVTYNDGPELRAGNVTVRAPARNMTWAELGNQSAASAIQPGSGIQLSQNSPYGMGVPSSANVTVVYTGGANESVLGYYDDGETSS
jgi:hypothetical protein